MHVFYDYDDGRVYNGCVFLNRCFTELRGEMYWPGFQSPQAAGVPCASAGELFQLALKLL